MRQWQENKSPGTIQSFQAESILTIRDLLKTISIRSVTHNKSDDMGP